jgi:hypothetical protein
MTLRHLAQLAIVLIVAIAVAFIVTMGFPARAQGYPPCIDADAFVGRIKADGALVMEGKSSTTKTSANPGLSRRL